MAAHLSPVGLPLRDRRVAVVGLGRSGVAAAVFCAARGATVIGCDDQDLARVGRDGALAPLAEHAAVTLELGGLREATLRGADLIVLSPGVPPTRPALIAARAAGVPILGEIELAARFLQAPIVGITGTNGKSTVTSLCGAIAAATGRPSFCGGNLGSPLISAVDTPAGSAAGIVVCELSSFQLESTERLRCHAATILNLTPDHLDRHGTMTGYGDAKALIARNLADDATLVLNGDDPELQRLLQRMRRPPGVYFFSLLGPPPPQVLGGRAQVLGGYLDGEELVLAGVEGGLAARMAGVAAPEERYPSGELLLAGRHNLANALAAFLLMRASGLASPQQVRRAAAAFRPLTHRMELVVEADGVRYYDDSKGTNVDAVVAGVDGFPRPFVLIAGGRDKGGSYQPLCQALARSQVRGVVLIGEAAPLIEGALQRDPPAAPVLRAPTLEAAVAQAHALCRAGDAVILSPACSSYDMFRDYAHRAEVFIAAAQRLPGARLLRPAADAGGVHG